MRLVITQPDRLLFDQPVDQVIYEDHDGSRGVMRRHIDFASTLSPGLLTARAREPDMTEYLFAVDAGLVVKQGETFHVATRRCVQGDNLSTLKETVEKTFKKRDEKEERSRSALRLLEADFLRQFVEHEEESVAGIG